MLPSRRQKQSAAHSCGALEVEVGRQCRCLGLVLTRLGRGSSPGEGGMWEKARGWRAGGGEGGGRGEGVVVLVVVVVVVVVRSPPLPGTGRPRGLCPASYPPLARFFLPRAICAAHSSCSSCFDLPGLSTQ